MYADSSVAGNLYDSSGDFLHKRAVLHEKRREKLIIKVTKVFTMVTKPKHGKPFIFTVQQKTTNTFQSNGLCHLCENLSVLCGEN